jgi:hypothetical protein
MYHEYPFQSPKSNQETKKKHNDHKKKATIIVFLHKREPLKTKGKRKKNT